MVVEVPWPRGEEGREEMEGGGRREVEGGGEG